MPSYLLEEQLKLLEESVSELDLPVRIVNALETQGVLTIGQLLECCRLSSTSCEERCTCRELLKRSVGAKAADKWKPRCYLLDTPNVGEKTIKEVVTALAKAGFKNYSSPDEAMRDREKQEAKPRKKSLSRT